MITKKIQDLCTLELDIEKKILTIVFDPINLDLEAAQKLATEAEKILEEYKIDKVGVVSDMRDLLHITHTAREYFAKEDSQRIIVDAIVITSPVLRELFNLSMRFTRPIYPVKAFSSLLKARQWVEQEVEKYLKEQSA